LENIQIFQSGPRASINATLSFMFGGAGMGRSRDGGE
jgi:hypothetical protein